jgi:aldose 1-epimerase
VDADRLLPVRPPRALEGDEVDFRTGRRLAGVWLDTAFGGAAPAPDDPAGLVRHSLTGPDGHGVQLWADPVFKWVQVYTAEDFPERGRAIAIEPMTCPPDALNSGTDLITLQPGEAWTAHWGLKPL